MSTQDSSPNSSPKWGSTTKLVATFTIVAIVGLLVVQFREFIGPLLVSFILAFLLHPLASYLNKKLRLSWRLSVGLIFLVLIILLGGLIFLVGLALVGQVQSLIGVIQAFINQLPNFVTELSKQSIIIGSYTFSLSELDLSSITTQLSSSTSSLLGQAGNLISTLATSTLAFLGYLAFILLIAFFLLAEGGQVRENLIYIEIPGYDVDIRRLGRELTRIWDSYLRSQVVIFFLVVISYYLLMTLLGMHFTFGIAILAGIARFIPYLGPLMVWIVAGMVAYFSPDIPYNLQPWLYTIIVIGLGLVLDQIYDQYVVPRFMGQVLGLHPAAIMVAALVALRWLGIIGLVLAAPVLASVTLFARYAIRKLFDLDPWPEPELNQRLKMPQDRLFHRLKAWWRMRVNR